MLLVNVLRRAIAAATFMGFSVLSLWCGGPAGATSSEITATWAQASPTASPPASSNDLMAAVPGGHLLLFVPGLYGAPSSTWQWDGSTWTQQATTVNPSTASGMAYDAKLDKIVLVDASYQRTYTWTGSDWSLLLSGQGPSTSNGAMAYDQGTGDLMYFGGYVSQNVDGSDTWTFDGTSWTLRHPVTSPPGRIMGLAQDDPVSGNVIMFSGFSEPGQRNYSDTWQWDGATWTQLHPATSPPPRNSATSFVDQKVNRFFIEGGVTDAGIASDLWYWTGSNWQQVSLSTTPSTRYDQIMGYDPASETDVLFGGFNSNPPDFSDTWVLTTSSAPSAPMGVSALGASGSSATVSWSRSIDSGTSGTPSYTATASPSGASCTTMGTSCLITGLSQQVTYSISVVATNRVGSSEASSPATLTLTSSEPAVDPFTTPAAASVGVGSAAGYAVAGFEAGITVQVFVNDTFYGTATTDASGAAILNIVWSDPHVSINGGPLVAVDYGQVSIGVSGTSSTGGAKTVSGTFSLGAAPTLAATGFESIAALAIGSVLLVIGSGLVVGIRTRRQET